MHDFCFILLRETSVLLSKTRIESLDHCQSVIHVKKYSLSRKVAPTLPRVPSGGLSHRLHMYCLSYAFSGEAR